MIGQDGDVEKIFFYYFCNKTCVLIGMPLSFLGKVIQVSTQKISFGAKITVKLHMQTVYTQFRLLLAERSDQGVHCLLIHQVFKETAVYKGSF